MVDILKEEKELEAKRAEDKISQALKNAKIFTYNALAKTDWYIIRNADAGTAVPDEIKQSRAELREKLNVLETTLNAIDTSDMTVVVRISILLREPLNAFYGTTTE